MVSNNQMMCIIILDQELIRNLSISYLRKSIGIRVEISHKK